MKEKLPAQLNHHVPPQLYEILARTPYGSVKKGEVGIDRLVSEQVFTAAYPLHEVRPHP